MNELGNDSEATGQADSADLTAHTHSHGSYKSYVIGFALSVVLTVIPFWLVLADVGNSVGWVLTVIFVLGAAQILVHIHYFLHVDLQAEQGWQAISLIFTGIILFVVLAGSIWVMYHLHTNMMPPHFSDPPSTNETGWAAPDNEAKPAQTDHIDHHAGHK